MTNWCDGVAVIIIIIIGLPLSPAPLTSSKCCLVTSQDLLTDRHSAPTTCRCRLRLRLVFFPNRNQSKIWSSQSERNKKSHEKLFEVVSWEVYFFLEKKPQKWCRLVKLYRSSMLTLRTVNQCEAVRATLSLLEDLD